MAIRSLSDSLTSNDEQVAATAAAEAETAKLLGLEDARKLAEIMKGKLYLTDEELRAALEREAADAAKEKPGERRTIATARDGATATAQDDVAAREITEAARPVSVGVEPEGQRREAVTPIVSGIGAVALAALGDDAEPQRGSDRRQRPTTNLTDIEVQVLPLEGRAPNLNSDEQRARLQYMLDHARSVSGDDKGNGEAAASLIAAITSGNIDSAEMLYKQLQRAEQVTDVNMTIYGKNGRKTHIEKIDNGDGTPEIIFETSGGDSVGEGGMAGGRRSSGMVATAVVMGAVLGSKTANGNQQGLSQLLSAATDMPGMNPFSLVASVTPAQEQQREQSISLA